ncbi:adenosine receptor A2b-like [Actinia tenebrosa]|uniref:Adenosine receptor A2b-like n=1 Tax=Actinia tenebrosa TaxID=6105 RepID=A0A6P8IG80_ACTTE|nr:adenosine receptor A2b-like [Actinia tenebrosa]
MDQPITSCFISATNYSKSITNEDAKNMTFLEVINSVLALPTAAANALVIVAILTTSSLRTPSYLLLSSLAISDLTVGLFGQPGFTFIIFSFRNGNAKAYCYARWISTFFLVLFGNATLLTVAAISVDRYLAIRLKTRYRSVVTVRRVRLILMFILLYSIFAVCHPFLLSLTMSNVLAASVVIIMSFIILFCYTMSFRALKIHCDQIQPQGNERPNSTTQSNAIDVLKYRKLLKTMLLIMMLIIVCYLPLFGVFIIFSKPNPNRVVAWYLLSITTLNSLLNPVIYMTSMKDLRRVCIRMLRKIFRFDM